MVDKLNDSLESDNNQIIVVNIKYKEPHNKKWDHPTSITLELPEGILKQKSNESEFFDMVEQFAYNTIYRKFGVEVNYCQVWLPLESED